jgi:hypothetical protein
MSLCLSSVRPRSTSRVRHQDRARRPRRLWALEGLEDRVLLSGQSVYTVTDTSDSASDTGSLRYAVTQANADPNPSGSLIDFNLSTSDPGYHATTGSWTITLSSTLVLNESAGPEVIQGSGANLVTISGGNAVEVLQIASGVTAMVSGLTISQGDGGGIGNSGTLNVTDCVIKNNITTGGFGGGISNSGTLTVTGSAIEGNSADWGGGIENQGMMTISGCTITNNSANIDGGGIVNYNQATIADSTIAGNSAHGPGGGGIFN